MAIDLSALPRRAVLTGGMAMPFVADGAPAAPRALTFAVFRNGTRIGEHHISFAGDDDDTLIDAVMTVKLGPAPVFSYKRHAVEKRVGGALASLVAATDSDGKGERVSAEAAGGAIRISCPSGMLTTPASVWLALKGKLDDGSPVEYRRI